MAKFNPSEPDTFQRELIPEGPHAARCARVIEIGKQSSRYGIANRAVIALSIPGVTVNIGGEDKQSFISNPYGITITSSDKGNMRDYTSALDPTATCLGDFLTKACQIQIQHEQKGDRMIQKIKQISPLIAGIEVDPLDTEPFWFEWESPDGDLWAQIPDFQKNLIRGSVDGKVAPAVNYPGSLVEQMVMTIEGSESDDFDPELPI